MSTLITITNYGLVPFVHPLMVGDLAVDASRAFTLKQVSADDLSDNYATLAAQGIQIDEDGTDRPGYENFASVDTIADTTHIVTGDTTGGAFTLTLPAVGNVAVGHRIYITFVTDGGDLTIDGDGAEEIDGGTTVVMVDAGETLKIISDGVAWTSITAGE